MQAFTVNATPNPSATRPMTDITPAAVNAVVAASNEVRVPTMESQRKINGIILLLIITNVQKTQHHQINSVAYEQFKTSFCSFD